MRKHSKKALLRFMSNLAFCRTIVQSVLKSIYCCGFGRTSYQHFYYRAHRKSICPPIIEWASLAIEILRYLRLPTSLSTSWEDCTIGSRSRYFQHFCFETGTIRRLVSQKLNSPGRDSYSTLSHPRTFPNLWYVGKTVVEIQDSNQNKPYTLQNMNIKGL